MTKNTVKTSKPADTKSTESDIGHTSDLPFASRRCDGPDIDIFETVMLKDSERETAGPGATEMALFIVKVNQVAKLLDSADEYLKAAYGGQAGRMRASIDFDRGMNILTVARRFLEESQIDAEADHDRLCNC